MQFTHIALECGFEMHHAESEYIMLNKWLLQNRTNTLPSYCTHYVGCAGAVINDKNEILLVKERSGDKKDQWGIPGGRANLGE